ncbi:MAG TPA: lamin tail domain-containing protein [Bacteroidia bacterium]|nr:lamin tail domain-containing protein [Bacteroidia bacterium]
MLSAKRTLIFLLTLFGFSGIVHTQVTDNFGDGDFTANPTWSGDNADFIVNASFQLQLNALAADTSSLSFSNPFATNCEWQFWSRMNFSPSDNNNLRYYLTSDVANLEGPVNGYYIRMGENGSFDSVDLWEQSGSTHTKIIDGLPGRVALSNNIVRVKVTRTAAGLWTVFSDTTGNTNWVQEGTITNNIHTTSNFAGLFCKYTVSNINDFFLDDVYCGPMIVDLTAPQLVSLNVISATQLDVTFDEPVEQTSAETEINYAVSNGFGNPSSALRDGSNTAVVHLTFPTNFTSSFAYQLYVANVQDNASNAMTMDSLPFQYVPVAVPVYHDVVINEIMADPSPVVGLPGAEFVELYNRSASNFDITGWKFGDGSTTGTIGSFILSAGSYVIVCANADTALFSPFGDVVGISSFPSLNNAGDNLDLFDPSSNPIDSVNYDIAWYQDAVKEDGGWTLELINPDAGSLCASAGNWIASNNAAGGTPGVQNSVFNNSPDVTSPSLVSVFALDSMHIEICFSESIDPALLANVSSYLISNGIGAPATLTFDTATLACVTLETSIALTSSSSYTVFFTPLADCAGNVVSPNQGTFVFYLPGQFDVVLNEIMADPDPAVALPNEEYIELKNNTAYPIRLEDWTLSVGTTTRALPFCILPADSFIVLTSTTAAALFTGVNVVGVTSFQSLTNTSGSLVLRDANGQLIHTVSYTDDWYRSSAKAEGGWSLEQIDPLNPCGGSTNWIASNSSSGGTPGYTNSVETVAGDATAPQIVRVSVYSADSIRVWFSESMDSTTMNDVTRYTIDNSIGNPLAVYPNGPDFMSCQLKLASPISSGIMYHISVSSLVSDCVGNPLGSSTAPFALPEAVAQGDIVINEILFDPLDGGSDFIEIYNRSQKVIDLAKVVICTKDTLANVLQEIAVIAPEGYLLFPGEYLVISENIYDVQLQYPAQTDINRCLQMESIPSMNVDGDVILLTDTAFNTVDMLVYSSSWHFPMLQETKGVSLERIDFDRTTQDATNWHSASEDAGFATPTQKNSQFNAAGTADDGAVTITSEVFSPDNDSYNDVVTISYLFSTPGLVANITIYDSRGRLVRTLVKSELLGTESGAFSWDGTMDDRSKARVGTYVIFFEAFTADGTVKQYKRVCVLAAKF